VGSMLMMMWVRCCCIFNDNAAGAGAIIRFDAYDDVMLLMQC
jgi:hypothetical protein